ncbi:MAG: uridine diphosphate-N-acetylglucosamine-binding protein YvcK [Anaerolineales bacterium]
MTLTLGDGIVDSVQAKKETNSPDGRFRRRWALLTRWLEPGLGVKRWLVMLVLGTAMVGLGLAILLLDAYRAHPESPILALLSLRALPRIVRALLLGAAGIGLMVLSIFKLNRALLAPYVQPGHSVVDAVARYRRLGKGPKIVAIGGGTGLSTLLRGLKKHTGNVTAIVSVADDGGSSGRLRQALGLPPPGDIRACLAALSEDEDLLTQLFQYRFRQGEELLGHSFGNLFIAALSSVTGSFEEGVREAGRVLGIAGQVLPSTSANIELIADKALAVAGEAVRIEGESRIPAIPGRIRRVQLEPVDPPAFPAAIQAILNADMIVIGPGSLYTSILANLLVPRLAEAIEASRAFRVYVCNIATQKGETDHLDCCQHLEAIQAHINRSLVDIVVANDNLELLPGDGLELVEPGMDHPISVPIYTTDLIDSHIPSRHDSDKLAETLIALLEERTGPLEMVSADNHETGNGT